MDGWSSYKSCRQGNKAKITEISANSQEEQEPFQTQTCVRIKSLKAGGSEGRIEGSK